MAKFIDVDGEDVAEQHRDDIKQPAVKMEIVKFEQGLVGESAFVISDDQFAIAILQALIIRDGVVLECPEDDGQQGDQCAH